MADAMNYKPGDLPDLKYKSESLKTTSNWLYMNLFFLEQICLCVESYRFDNSFFCGRENMENSYKFFENKDCKYYPCHEGKEHLNCMFCYCPFYSHVKCPRNVMYIEADGKKIKDCTECTFPHEAKNYEMIMKLLA